jgi:hypothetical protein
MPTSVKASGVTTSTLGRERPTATVDTERAVVGALQGIYTLDELYAMVEGGHRCLSGGASRTRNPMPPVPVPGTSVSHRGPLAWLLPPALAV